MSNSDDIVEIVERHTIDARIECEDGWVMAGCGCGWGPFPTPDHETAADMFAAHCVEVALDEQQ